MGWLHRLFGLSGDATAAQEAGSSLAQAAAGKQSSSSSQKEVSGVCDICNQATSTGSGGKVIKNREMKRATDGGFNGMAIGSNARMLAMVGIDSSESTGEWKRKVMLDTTDWLLCPECQKEIRRYL